MDGLYFADLSSEELEAVLETLRDSYEYVDEYLDDDEAMENMTLDEYEEARRREDYGLSDDEMQEDD